MFKNFPCTQTFTRKYSSQNIIFFYKHKHIRHKARLLIKKKTAALLHLCRSYRCCPPRLRRGGAHQGGKGSHSEGRAEVIIILVLWKSAWCSVIFHFRAAKDWVKAWNYVTDADETLSSQKTLRIFAEFRVYYHCAWANSNKTNHIFNRLSVDCFAKFPFFKEPERRPTPASTKRDMGNRASRRRPRLRLLHCCHHRPPRPAWKNI